MSNLSLTILLWLDQRAYLVRNSAIFIDFDVHFRRFFSPHDLLFIVYFILESNVHYYIYLYYIFLYMYVCIYMYIANLYCFCQASCPAQVASPMWLLTSWILFLRQFWYFRFCVCLISPISILCVWHRERRIIYKERKSRHIERMSVKESERKREGEWESEEKSKLKFVGLKEPDMKVLLEKFQFLFDVVSLNLLLPSFRQHFTTCSFIGVDPISRKSTLVLWNYEFFFL